MTPDQIAGLPIRALQMSTKNVTLELADGKRFQIIGGKNRRPHNGVAGFTPAEILEIIKPGNQIDEKTFRGLIEMKERFGPGTEVVEITQGGEDGAAS